MVAVELDDERTWPRQALDLLERNEPSLRDEKCAPDLLLNELRRTLEHHRVVAFHCTRLTEDELDDVRRHGLRPLSPELVEERVEKQVRAGRLDRWYADEMLAHSRRLVGDRMRRGRIWAILGISALGGEPGVGPPLRMWGGEILRSIALPPSAYALGSAYVIEFETTIASLTVCRLEQALIDQFAFNREWQDEDGAHDACIEQPVTPTAIRRILQKQDPEFESLTRYSKWNEPP